MTKFIQGRELSRRFYTEVIEPLLDSDYPTLRYSVALIGKGSDVLGYDTERSMDHDWGPRLKLFLHENDYQVLKEELSDILPANYRLRSSVFSTNYKDNEGDPTQSMAATNSPPIHHKIEITCIQTFFYEWLGIYPDEELCDEDWLTFPQQRLLEIIAGEVIYDGLKCLNEYRSKFSYFPDIAWRYMLSVQWMKIAELEPIIGRCIELNDSLGFRLIAAQIVNLELKLCFMMERKYIPYSKWIGTAFRELQCADKLSSTFLNAMTEKTISESEEWLLKSYIILAEMYNDLKLTKPIPTQTAHFHNRPYRIIHADDIADALWQSLKGTSLAKIEHRNGTIDQLNLTEYDSELVSTLKNSTNG